MATAVEFLVIAIVVTPLAWWLETKHGARLDAADRFLGME